MRDFVIIHYYEDEFKKEKGKLKTKLAILKRQLDSTEDRAAKWLELTEETFNFARYARKAFMCGDIEKKRSIFASLGQNYVLTDKKVSIKANDWFVPIEKAYPELEAEYKRLELEENVDIATQNAQYAELILSWGTYCLSGGTSLRKCVWIGWVMRGPYLHK